MLKEEIIMDDKNKECGCGHDHEHEDSCGCGHNHDHEHEDGCCGGHEQMMTLVLEDNSEMKCSVLGVFEVEDEEYIALLPVGDDEVLLYKYVESENEDGFELLNIESDEEFEKVENVFFEIFDGEDFEEDEEDDDEEDEE